MSVNIPVLDCTADVLRRGRSSAHVCRAREGSQRAGDTVQKLTLAVALAEGDILVLNIHCLLAGTQILILSSLFVTWRFLFVALGTFKKP